MPREVIDTVVMESLRDHRKGGKYGELKLEYGDKCVQKQSPKTVLEKSQYGISGLDYFAALVKAYKAVQIPESVQECTIEIESGEGQVVTRCVSKEVFSIVKVLAYEQVSESDTYSDAIAKVFVQFLPQVLKGVEQYRFIEDSEWPRITRMFFRYGVDFICDVLKQKRVLWEVIDEEV